MQGRYNSLFLRTGNSGRSIMAEAILNSKGQPNFTVHSAGSHPSGTVRPETLRQLEMAHLPTEVCAARHGMNSLCLALQSSTLFLPFAIRAKEVCPIWPGQRITAHWGVPDPATVHGTEAQGELWQEVAAQAVGDRAGIHLIVLPLGGCNGRQHQPMRYLHLLSVRRQVIVDPASNKYCLVAAPALSDSH